MSWQKGATWPRLGRTNPVILVTPRGQKAKVRGFKVRRLLDRIIAAGKAGAPLRQLAEDIPDRWRVRELLQKKLVTARFNVTTLKVKKLERPAPLPPKLTLPVPSRDELNRIIDERVLRTLRKAKRVS